MSWTVRVSWIRALLRPTTLLRTIPRSPPPRSRPFRAHPHSPLSKGSRRLKEPPPDRRPSAPQDGTATEDDAPGSEPSSSESPTPDDEEPEDGDVLAPPQPSLVGSQQQAGSTAISIQTDPLNGSVTVQMSITRQHGWDDAAEHRGRHGHRRCVERRRSRDRRGDHPRRSDGGRDGHPGNAGGRCSGHPIGSRTGSAAGDGQRTELEPAERERQPEPERHPAVQRSERQRICIDSPG